MRVELTQIQTLFYRLYVIAPNNFLFFHKTFSLPELEKQLAGSKRSGYTRTFLKDLIERDILEFVKEEKKNGHWIKKYQINLKKLEDIIVNTEWYVLTRDVVDRIEPKGF